MTLDPLTLVRSAGYLGLSSIIFAETGLFFGFFLPGDSVLFTAGFLASQGYLRILLLVGLTFSAAVLGDSFGYLWGRTLGQKLFTRKESLLFRREYVERTRDFYRRHGGKAVFFARFLPIIRSFAPPLAGMGEMPYPLFLAFSVSGSLLWAVGLPLAGYYLGRLIPDVDRYLLPIIAAIIVISLLPSFFHLRRTRREKGVILTK